MTRARDRKGGTVKRGRILAAFAAIGLIAAACSSGGGGSSPSASGSAAPVTLTIWHNYGTNQSYQGLKNLADAFHQLHPNITVKVVNQPGTNYFSLLNAAAISKSGPDLAVMWTGLFTIQYKSFLTNLKGIVPQSDLDKIDPSALKYTADGFDAANGPYEIPFQRQFYIGFYNKAAFKKAGVKSVPTDWSQLFSACQKLKTAGYMPMTYGNGGQPISTEFYPWEDLSYIMIGAYPVDQWINVYNGQTQWNNPAIQAQLSTWAKLKTNGCTNSDVLTKTDNVTDFSTGKAAMIVDGTWDTQTFTKALGNNVGAFLPPFSNSPIKGVVDYAGDGLAMMNYTPHRTEAAEFLDFLTTSQAVAAVNAAGLIPALTGSSTSNPVNQEMLDFAAKDGMVPYPMLDNVTQTDVVNTGSKELPSVLNGSITPAAATQAMVATWNALPSDQKGSSYP